MSLGVERSSQQCGVWLKVQCAAATIITVKTED